ncbi:MAG: helix-turn-helix domain-containing protein [Chloroflexi bacterium]|nr:helix-turn-helix domain-containing protein [Chloroflexota bacterium]
MESRRIRELRHGLGLSQERFAQLLGVSLQTVRRWEGGLTRPLPIISLRLEKLARQAGTAKRGIPKAGGIPMRKTGVAPGGFGLGGLFKGIGSLLDLLSQMAEEGQEEHARSGEREALGGRAKGVYGFSVRMGLGGKPVIQQFGNVRETEVGPVVADTREPLVDVMDEGDRLVVIAELPGVEEKDVRIKVEGDALDISAATGGRRYHKEVPLPSAMDAATLQSSYRNGILEIKLAKGAANDGAV